MDTMRESPGAGLASIGAGWGMVAAALFGALRWFNGEASERSAERGGDLAFFVVFAAPFTTALLARRLDGPMRRAASGSGRGSSRSSGVSSRLLG
jgi:hypothetical protein